MCLELERFTGLGGPGAAAGAVSTPLTPGCREPLETRTTTDKHGQARTEARLARAPYLRAVTNQERVMLAAAKDGHCPICPTQEAVKDGEIVGAVSLGSVPLVHVWMDSKRVKARDSVRLLRELEERAARMGFRVICCPCTDSSPYRPVMERLGFLDGGGMRLFYKQIEPQRHGGTEI